MSQCGMTFYQNVWKKSVYGDKSRLAIRQELFHSIPTAAWLSISLLNQQDLKISDRGKFISENFQITFDCVLFGANGSLWSYPIQVYQCPHWLSMIAFLYSFSSVPMTGYKNYFMKSWFFGSNLTLCWYVPENQENLAFHGHNRPKHLP